jgi:O-glycosyl hydrolase
MRPSVRGLLIVCLGVVAAFAGCVSPTGDDPAPKQQTPTDTIKNPTDTSSKKKPPPPPPPPPTQPTATAALGPAAQTLKGWGLYPTGGGGLYGRSGISDALYASGISFVRVAFRDELYVSGTNVSNMTLDAGNLGTLVQSLQLAQSYGVNQYIVSVWSPPAAMKTNNSVIAGSLRTDAESSYVAFLTKVVLSLKAAGMPLPMAISIQNEPERVEPYNSAFYPVDQWQRVIIAARASFDQNGLSAVPLFGPETGQFTYAIWLDSTAKTPGYLGGSGFPALGSSSALNAAVGAYALHGYYDCYVGGVDAGIQAHPKDLWMTEFSELTTAPETQYMIDTYRALAAHLVIAPVDYWAWWTGYTQSSGPPDGLSLLGGNSTPIYSKRYWALKQLWTTARPGWVVTPMTTTDPDLQVGLGNQAPCNARVDLLAFTSPDHSTVAVMMTNTTTKAKLIAVSGLPGTTVQAYESDANNDMTPQAAVPVTKGTANIPLPPGSAVLAVSH